MTELYDDSETHAPTHPVAVLPPPDRMVGVHFTTPVDGLDPDDGTPFLATRHRVRAASLQPDVEELLFVSSVGEIVGRWRTELVEQVVWPKDPHADQIEAAAGGARPRSTARDRYPRAGERWEDDEDDRLAQAFEAGTTIPAMARDHRRSPGAIRARLVLLGLVDPGTPPTDVGRARERAPR